MFSVCNQITRTLGNGIVDSWCHSCICPFIPNFSKPIKMWGLHYPLYKIFNTQTSLTISDQCVLALATVFALNMFCSLKVWDNCRHSKTVWHIIIVIRQVLWPVHFTETTFLQKSPNPQMLIQPSYNNGFPMKAHGMLVNMSQLFPFILLFLSSNQLILKWT